MQKVLLGLLALIIASCSNSTKSTEESTSTPEVVKEVAAVVEKSVFFKHPADGATVPSPVFIEMGVNGMTVEPAGVVKEGYGHHHILINQIGWPEGTVIPMSDSTKHYGKGQLDTTLELEAGTYTLTLQFADGVHSSYGESLASSITVTVE